LHVFCLLSERQLFVKRMGRFIARMTCDAIGSNCRAMRTPERRPVAKSPGIDPATADPLAVFVMNLSAGPGDQCPDAKQTLR